MRPKVRDNGDGTYTVEYTPEDVGLYSVNVKYAGVNVPGAPFLVQTSPAGDASKVKVPGKNTNDIACQINQEVHAI